jgi:hypothetical protein
LSSARAFPTARTASKPSGLILNMSPGARKLAEFYRSHPAQPLFQAVMTCD